MKRLCNSLLLLEQYEGVSHPNSKPSPEISGVEKPVVSGVWLTGGLGSASQVTLPEANSNNTRQSVSRQVICFSSETGVGLHVPFVVLEETGKGCRLQLGTARCFIVCSKGRSSEEDVGVFPT
ncbi:hypothetical protein TNIN_400101 [Trichonephila inaurata madagascariensis]|uniref:Uncharacterized protein n=1 Tax=Trichonephila inaurata madagascariensis TaxID=2747483 RepID=A0A8X7CPG3_9ARAC|nr:hypothetical protein TNIN_400101 [Trichonephila inaurata madagascariensis]